MEDDRAARHWVVIGLMGSGKSTVGTLLAQRSGRVFVDNDVQLRAMTARTAREVQAEEGRDALHDYERRALLHALDDPTPAVVAAAASAGVHPDVQARLREVAVVIWLRADVTELSRRVVAQGHRPLAADVRAQLERQASERSAVFAELADIVVDAAQPPDVIVDTLLPEL